MSPRGQTGPSRRSDQDAPPRERRERSIGPHKGRLCRAPSAPFQRGCGADPSTRTCPQSRAGCGSGSRSPQTGKRRCSARRRRASHLRSGRSRAPSPTPTDGCGPRSSSASFPAYFDTGEPSHLFPLLPSPRFDSKRRDALPQIDWFAPQKNKALCNLETHRAGV